MRYRQTDHALACVGAVIGAGFASGREVMAFFSQYGALSWVLILLSTGTMSAICALTMRKVGRCASKSWCSLYDGQPNTVRFLGEGCVFVLMAVTGGAMLSAAAELVALLLPVHGAYWIGLAVSVLLAWFLAQQHIRSFAMISGALTIAVLVSYLLTMGAETSSTEWVSIAKPLSLPLVLKAAVSAVAYACMNMAIALGVICQSACSSSRRISRTSVIFGWILTGLLLTCNFVLLQHEDLQDAAFPIVRLLSRFGQAGFYFSAMVLYLAVLTTAVAIFSTLKNMASSHTENKWIMHGITVGAPLVLSFIGFGQIVEQVYAPIGLACLGLVFVPALFIRRRWKCAQRKAQ